MLADRTTVSWPGSGEAPVSTTAFLVPYRPAELRVDIPCPAVQAAVAAPARTVLFTTAVLQAAGTESLLIDAENGQLRFVLGDREVATATPAPGACDVTVASTASATTITVGTTAVATLPGEPVPEVFAFATDLSPEQARGMTATARTQALFESVPSTGKYVLLGAHALLALGSLALLARSARPRAPDPASDPASPGGPPAGRLRWLVDLAVVIGLTGWTIIGPQTDDDGYATVTIRNSLESGDIGNYYRWFNASEAPFTLVQHLLQPLTALSVAPLWLRVPSLLAGIAAWYVLSRGVLGAMVPALSRSWALRVLAALSFLGWWLPYNLGVRPEPFVALTLVGVLAVLLRATAPGARFGLLGVGVAAALAGIALAITPTGILVFAVVLVFAPRIWRVVTDAGRAPVAQVTSRIALFGCLASTGLVLMFADQSLAGTLRATSIHSEIGPNFAWYEEFNRYSALLGIDHQSTATKRLPVLLTLALLLIVALLIVRRVRALSELRDVHLLTAVTVTAFALLWVTPSKWTHHFGSLAGLGAAFLVVAVVAVALAARRRSADRAVLVVGVAGGGLVALAAGLSFAGPNAWFLYGSYGMPWLEGPIRPLGVPLGNPVLWAFGAAILVAAAALLRRVSGRIPRDASRITAAAAPAVVAVPALAVSIAVLAASFSVALLRQTADGSYSLAGQNLDHLTGSSCGIVDKVEAMPDVPGGPLPASGGTDAVDDFVQRDGYLAGEPPPDVPGTGTATYLWGSLAGGDVRTGSLTTRWFSLRGLAPDREVAVSAAGNLAAPNRLALEFGRSGPGGVTPLGERVLDDGAIGEAGWRPLGVAAGDVPAGADRVRVLAQDRATGIGGWLAVTGPRLRQVVPLDGYLADRGPVLVDWPMAWAAPCADIATITDGIAETPRVRLAVPEAYAWMADIATNPVVGGGFAGVPATGLSREVPSRLAGQPEVDWGGVRLLDYPLARDRYETGTDRVWRWGWEGQP